MLRLSRPAAGGINANRADGRPPCRYLVPQKPFFGFQKQEMAEVMALPRANAVPARPEILGKAPSPCMHARKQRGGHETRLFEAFGGALSGARRRGPCGR